MVNNNAANRMGEIGIFLGKRQWKQLTSNQMGGGLAELVRAAQMLNLKPVWFTLNDSYIKNNLAGAVKQDGIWQLGNYPLPKVIYDRATFKKKDRVNAKKLRQYLTEQGSKFVNTRSAFPKWKTFQTLADDPLILSHLPHTIRFCRTFHLEDMLTQYGMVCVKSNWGSRGKEVVFVKRSEQGFTIDYPKGSTNVYKTFNEVTQALYDFFGNKDILVQQAIPLAAYQGCAIDIRVLVQKISLTTWDCTAVIVRRAAQGRRITNISMGGGVAEIQQVINELWPALSNSIYRQIEKLGIKTAKTLEESNGPLGELGIDMALDEAGSVWLIEVNGKPAKSTVRKLNNIESIQKAYQRPLKYAQMLLEEGCYES